MGRAARQLRSQGQTRGSISELPCRSKTVIVQGPPGIKAAGPCTLRDVGKSPDFAPEMTSPKKVREDLTTKSKLYERVGIREHWRLDATGRDLHGTPLASDTLENGAHTPRELHRSGKDRIRGRSEAAGITSSGSTGGSSRKPPAPVADSCPLPDTAHFPNHGSEPPATDRQ